jgi:NAD(P)-dependent dehydrogenase (short-subunit alcohol dehydrogenase family)
MMAGRVDGQVAIITGATSGIGEGTAERFVEEGARVVVAGRSENKGQEIASRLGTQAVFCRTDVTKEKDIVALIECAQKHFGRLDCLFNNAGTATSGFRVEEITEESFAYESMLLVGSIILGVKHAAPLMRAQGGGSIINNGSIAGMWSGYGPHVYSAAKAAVIHLTRCLAMELAKDRIRVNAISPGVIATPIFGRVLGFGEERTQETVSEVGAVLGKYSHLGRPGLPEDIASAAVYFASKEGSYVTGHNLVVDGGMPMGLTMEQVCERVQQLNAIGQR